jgi:hypothetical protein
MRSVSSKSRARVAKESAEATVRMLAGFRCFSDKVTGSKEVRADPFAAQVHGKSWAATDFVAWAAGKNPNLKTIFASHSDDLGMRTNLDLQRALTSKVFVEAFPDTCVGEQGWMCNTSLIEFAHRSGSFRNTTINGAINGMELHLGVHPHRPFCPWLRSCPQPCEFSVSHESADQQVGLRADRLISLSNCGEAKSRAFDSSFFDFATWAAAILQAPARQDGELLQDGTTEHLGAPSKHPKRQAGPAVSAPGSARPYPLLAVPVSWVVSQIDAPWKP